MNDDAVEDLLKVLVDLISRGGEWIVRRSQRKGDRWVRYLTPMGAFWLSPHQQAELVRRLREALA